MQRGKSRLLCLLHGRVIIQSHARASRTRLNSTAAQGQTTSRVPDDPDILTTQSPSLNPSPQQASHSSETFAAESASTGLSGSFPRLQYKPPPLGKNAAYDAALALIAEERALTQQKLRSTKAKLKRLESQSAAAADTDQDSVTERLAALRAQCERLLVQLDLDDPEVRWRASRGDYDLSRPVYRFLANENWRLRPLALLMQRVTQMHVTPDVIPLIAPQLAVSVEMADATTGRTVKPDPGAFVLCRHGATLPTITIQSFAAEPIKVAVAILDADVPDVAGDTYTTRLHYLQTDITLDATTSVMSRDNGTVLTEWLPPHPERGTPYHRLCVLVWQLPATPPQPNAPLATKVPGAIERRGFNAQHYAQQNGLHAVGITFWRQLWDAELAGVMEQYPEAGYVDSVRYRRVKA